MKRSTITVVLASSLALALGLWYGPRFYRETHAGPLPNLLGLVPSDSTLIVYADLASLRNTPWIEQLASAAPPANLDADYADFVRSTGFAFERDLDRVVLAELPGSAQTLVFADGRFDQKKIGAYALRSGRLEHRNGRALYVLPSVKPGKTISLTFAESNRVVISDGGDLFATLAASSGSPNSFAPALRERLSRVAGAPLFAVVNVSQSSAAGSISAEKAGSSTPFRDLRWVSFAAQPEANQVLLSAEGECDRPDQAQKVAASLEFLRTILSAGLSDPKTRGHISADTAATTARFLAGARISTDAERVRLLLGVSPDAFSSVIVGAAKPAPNSR